MPDLIVIGYDGSIDANRAIEAAHILDPDRALVVNVWQPPLTTATPMGAAPTLPAPGEDEQLEAAAHQAAAEGAALAAEAGLAAEPIILRGAAGDVGGMLASLAEERDATAIVVGRRGVSRLEAAVLGSVSNDTVRQAHCAVLVVPAPDDE